MKFGQQTRNAGYNMRFHLQQLVRTSGCSFVANSQKLDVLELTLRVSGETEGQFVLIVNCQISLLLHSGGPTSVAAGGFTDRTRRSVRQSVLQCNHRKSRVHLHNRHNACTKNCASNIQARAIQMKNFVKVHSSGTSKYGLFSCRHHCHRSPSQRSRQHRPCRLSPSRTTKAVRRLRLPRPWLACK